MNYEKFKDVITRIRNGEKPEDIIDFNEETKEGEFTPQKVLEIVEKVTYCRNCKNPLKGDELILCEECIEKDKEKYLKNGFNSLDPKNVDWGALIGLMIVADIFSKKD